MADLINTIKSPAGHTVNRLYDMESPNNSPSMSRRPSVRPRLRIPLKGRNNGPSLNSPISGPPVAESGRVRLTVTLGTNGHQTVCEANEYDTLTLILESLCLRKGLAMDRYFLAVDNMGVRRTPSASENVHQTLTQYGLSKLLLVEKSVYQVCLSKTSKESHGYNVICQDKDTTQKGVFIWAITANSVVATQDLVVAGDRVLQINNVLCSTMSFEDVLGKLRQNKVELTIASNRNMDDNPFCKPVAFDFEAAAEYRTIFMSISEIEALGCPAVPAKHDQVEVNSIGTVKPILPENLVRGSCELQAAPTVCSDSMTDEELAKRTTTLVDDCNKLSGHIIRENGKISRDEMRIKVLREILGTEKQYTVDLRYLKESYLVPLAEEDWLTDKQKAMLTNNTNELLAFHTEFLRDLEAAFEAEVAPVLSDMEKEDFNTVAKTFLTHMESFDLYSSYCLHYPKAFDLVQTVINSPDRPLGLDAFLRERNPAMEQSKSLESYLIKPVQRVLKYPLLMRELHGFTAQTSPDYQSVESALHSIKQVNVTINEIKREQDNALKAKELFANADWADESVDMKRLGNLVYSGDVYVSVSKREGERWECFLFQREIIMFRKKERASGPTYRLKERLPVTHLVVRDAIQDDGRQVWELVNAQDSKAKNNNPKSYFIECRTAEEKKYWMNKTKGVLKDALKAKKQLPGKPAVAEEVDFLDFLKEAGEAGGE